MNRYQRHARPTDSLNHPAKPRTPPRLPDGAVYELKHEDAATGAVSLLYARYDALKQQWAVSLTAPNRSHCKTGKTLFPLVAGLFKERGDKPQGWFGTLLVDGKLVADVTPGSPFTLLEKLDKMYRAQKQGAVQ